MVVFFWIFKAVCKRLQKAETFCFHNKKNVIYIEAESRRQTATISLLTIKGAV
jgi:hypothetical protein